jgi:hypothetical protein
MDSTLSALLTLPAMRAPKRLFAKCYATIGIAVCSAGAVQARPTEYYIEALDDPSGFRCDALARFALLVNHDRSGLCSLVVGLSFVDPEGDTLSGVEFTGFTFDDIWARAPTLVAAPTPSGFIVVIASFGLVRRPASPRTPVGVIEVRIADSFDGELRLQFDNPVILKGGIVATPSVGFEGVVDEDLFLRESELYRVRCPRFVRGDVNDDRSVNLTDAVVVLRFLFLGADAIRCKHAADVNDSDIVDLSDIVYLLSYLFQRGPALAQPFPEPGPYSQPRVLSCHGFYPGSL